MTTAKCTVCEASVASDQVERGVAVCARCRENERLLAEYRGTQRRIRLSLGGLLFFIVVPAALAWSLGPPGPWRGVVPALGLLAYLGAFRFWLGARPRVKAVAHRVRVDEAAVAEGAPAEPHTDEVPAESQR